MKYLLIILSFVFTIGCSDPVSTTSEIVLNSGKYALDVYIPYQHPTADYVYFYSYTKGLLAAVHRTVRDTFYVSEETIEVEYYHSGTKRKVTSYINIYCDTSITFQY